MKINDSHFPSINPTIAISCISLVVFVILSSLLITNRLQAFDQKITNIILSYRNPVVTEIMLFVTFLGSIFACFLFLLIASIFCYAKRNTQNLSLLFKTFILGPLVSLLLKELFQRPRPDEFRLIEEIGYSYPSGHAFSSLLFYGALIYMLWKSPTIPMKNGLNLLLSSIILLTGVSRIYLGVHYPSDVLAGYASSLPLLLLFIWFDQKKLAKATIVVRKYPVSQ